MTDRLTHAEERSRYWHGHYVTADRARHAAIAESKRQTDIARRATRMLSTVREANAARLSVIAAIASALADGLPGDQWHTVHAIERLAAGEIDAETAMKEAWKDDD